MGSDKEMASAQHALIDPLYEPDPSDETGLNSHFRSTFAPAPRQTVTPPGSSGGPKDSSVYVRPQHTGTSVDSNPYRRARASSAATKSHSTVTYGEVTPSARNAYPSPPNSASPRKDAFPAPYRTEAFGSLNEPRRSGGRPRGVSQPMAYKAPQQGPSTNGGLARSGSLRERYPGDTSHRPLDIIRNDSKKAHRAPHLRKKNFQRADVIDRLDDSTTAYHHDGPFDAANAARNFDYKYSPIAAVQDSNEEALRATPREAIVDAVTKHRPLDKVASVPPGVPDRFGRVLDYEEGADLQREPGGDYRRWPGVEYLPGDLKGKGEPSYSIDKALKDHKQYGETGTEMASSSHYRRRGKSLGAKDVAESQVLQGPFDDDQEVGESSGTGTGTSRSVGGALKKRFGSLRRKRAEV